ncbi:hypothetical protein LY90DRAFT_101826 [Neocallimastix californiae]|uniref:Uncharacterized protein n=1 Tax=Neocallimastix californiae TaxID=1754190 RepID=A0A1Y2F1A0_9FUNG|nr:hypothetical protein LY90DRAFT_101826 [Neocallimastix californiae]|eukprot:ORY77126.1 hypothetical protein LY90DRAFT_101826 [Neocallimastix californiae]
MKRIKLCINFFWIKYDSILFFFFFLLLFIYISIYKHILINFKKKSIKKKYKK